MFENNYLYKRLIFTLLYRLEPIAQRDIISCLAQYIISQMGYKIKVQKMKIFDYKFALFNYCYSISNATTFSLQIFLQA